MFCCINLHAFTIAAMYLHFHHNLYQHISCQRLDHCLASSITSIVVISSLYLLPSSIFTRIHLRTFVLSPHLSHDPCHASHPPYHLVIATLSCISHRSIVSLPSWSHSMVRTTKFCSRSMLHWGPLSSALVLCSIEDHTWSLTFALVSCSGGDCI